MCPRQRGKDLARVKGRLAHRQPARAALAQGTFRHGPVIAPAPVGIGIDRGRPVLDPHHRDRHIGPIPLGARVHGHGEITVLPAPLEMHPVVVQRHPRDRRVIAHMIGLVRVDLHLRRKIALVHVKRPPDPMHPGCLEISGQLRQPVGVQRRIAAPRQDQIPLHLAIDHAPGRQNARLEPVRRAKRIQRVKRGQRLGHAGGRRRDLLLGPFQKLAAERIRHGKGHLARQLGLGHQRLCPRHGLLVKILAPQHRPPRGRGGSGRRRSRDQQGKARAQEISAGEAAFHGPELTPGRAGPQAMSNDIPPAPAP